MFANRNPKIMLIGAIYIGFALTSDGASAISLEAAKKCNALTAKAFPPRVIGNPAAGSAKGSGRDERDFYKKCVANEGKMNEPAK